MSLNMLKVLALAVALLLPVQEAHAGGFLDLFFSFFTRREAVSFVRAESGAVGRARLIDEFDLAVAPTRSYRAVATRELLSLAKNSAGGSTGGFLRKVLNGRRSGRGTYTMLRRPINNVENHFVSPTPLAPGATRSDAQRLRALPKKPTWEIAFDRPSKPFTPSSVIRPDLGQPGGGLQNVAAGRPTPIRWVGIRRLRN